MPNNPKMKHMTFKKGDFILINYLATVKETGEVFDTTIEETAKKENLYKEGEIYEPKLIVIGEGWVLKELDENLAKMELSKTSTVEISPEKAFGERDPNKMKRVPLRQLTAKGINPSPGMRVEHNGKMASVRTLGAGRVLLDFNPPLAGKTLIYQVTVNKRLRTKREKTKSLIHRRIPTVEADKFSFTLKGETASIQIPKEAFYLEGIQIAKRGIATDIQKFLPGTTTVEFTETISSEPTATDQR